MGLSKSEAIRLAMKEFIQKGLKESVTSKMLDILKSCRLSLREIDEAYYALKYGDDALRESS
ncbi:MAG: hypothetical protein QXN21_00990 [Candidatus Bathyarchaeia archaeon]